MNWLTYIETELKRVLPNQHPGRTRTIARRIAGIALRELYHSSSEDFLHLLHQAEKDTTVPEAVRLAAGRLAARLDANFNSPSVEPINDAMSIVEFVKKERA
ncbi:MAG: hypothetical protein AB1600_04725 [Bacteroidota bacterium]